MHNNSYWDAHHKDKATYFAVKLTLSQWTESGSSVNIKVVSKALLGLVDLRTYAERDKTSLLSANGTRMAACYSTEYHANLW